MGRHLKISIRLRDRAFHAGNRHRFTFASICRRFVRGLHEAPRSGPLQSYIPDRSPEIAEFPQSLSGIASVAREAPANPGDFPQFFPQVWKTLGRDRSGISLVQTRRPEVARPWENGKGRQTVTHAAV